MEKEFYKINYREKFNSDDDELFTENWSILYSPSRILEIFPLFSLPKNRLINAFIRLIIIMCIVIVILFLLVKMPFLQSLFFSLISAFGVTFINSRFKHIENKDKIKNEEKMTNNENFPVKEDDEKVIKEFDEKVTKNLIKENTEITDDIYYSFISDYFKKTEKEPIQFHYSAGEREAMDFLESIKENYSLTEDVANYNDRIENVYSQNVKIRDKMKRKYFTKKMTPCVKNIIFEQTKIIPSIKT